MSHKTRAAGLLIAICSLVLFADSTLADKALQGTWKVESAKRAGNASEDPVGDLVTFDGNSMTIKMKKGREQPKLTIETNTSTTPHEIDFTMERNGEKMVVLGIYEISGTTLKLCMARPGKDRPKTLDSQEKTQQMSIVAKKE